MGYNPKLFGFFTIFVICFLVVGNLYQISADSKVDTDLVFDSQDRLKHDNHQRIQIPNDSGPPVEEHWLTSTVNRIRRSINSIFSKEPHLANPAHHKQIAKPYHRPTTRRKQKNHSEFGGRRHRQANEYDEGEELEEDNDDYEAKNQIDLGQGQQEDDEEEGQIEGQTGQNEDEEGQFSELETGDGQGQEEGEGEGQDENGQKGDDTDYETVSTGNFNEPNSNPDDEDSNVNSGDFGSGDGEETTTTRFDGYGHPRIYRIAFTVMEPYLEDYKDRNSPRFQQLAERIKRNLDDIYSRIPGEQHVSVISIEQSQRQDPFKVRVTSDVESDGYSKSEEIKRAVYEPVNTIHRLGDLTTTDPEDLRFTEFGATSKKCNENELQCKSGQCVSANSRCDGNRDCNDNSDEEGCVRPGPVEPNFPDTTTTTEQTITETRTVPPTTTETRTNPPTTTETRTAPPPTTTTTTTTEGPETTTNAIVTPPITTTEPPRVTDIEPPIDVGSGAGDCRADDSVRCFDGSRTICADQVCDGLPDCDDEGDEVNCPGTTKECRVGEFKCDVYRCIPVQQRCDGTTHCTDGTDEHNCRRECNANEFACDDQCLPLSRKCDGSRDCLDNADEADCPGKDLVKYIE